jgi:hypothetical protein
MENSPDAIMEALEIVQEWAMEKLLADKAQGGDEQPEMEPTEPVDDPDGDELAPEPEADPAEPVEDDEPKSSVIGRYDFLGAPLKKKTAKVPVSRR